MASFDIEFSSPIPAGFRHGIGGPNVGGHTAPNWYIQYGMDFGGNVGVQVYAAFDAHITRYTPHNASHDSSHVYGAQLFMRSMNDRMGAFYTHLDAVPSGIAINSRVKRGDLLGAIMAPAGMAPHLHMAMVEIIGGAPNGRYLGVDLYTQILDISNTSDAHTITFNQDGTPASMA